MKRLLNITGIAMLVIMGGCSTSARGYKGEGINKISDSPCKKCNKIPFYVNGRRIKR